MEKFTDWHLYTGGVSVRFLDRMWKLHGVVRDWAYLYDDETLQPIGADVKDCHFYLRRLESMTREENEKYDKWMDFSHDVSGGSFEIIKDMLHFRAYVDETRGFIDMYYVAQLVNELRKDGFDCDRLIESGQAIDVATLNQK